MTITMKKILLSLLFLMFGLFGLSGTGSAADLSNTQGTATTPGYMTDTNGSVTGTAGNTYYNVDTWVDMFDTYNVVANGTGAVQQVVFNVIGDVPGVSAFETGIALRDGFGVTIKANQHTLYAGINPTATTNNGRDNTSGFYSSSNKVTNNTLLELEDANVVLANANGIFPITGAATAITAYKNVTYTNGNSTGGASPLRNDNGVIKLYGNNTFNIYEKNDRAGIDNQGEWVQGGFDIEVMDGTTTLNQSWENDQPLYTYGNTSSILNIHDNANLIWNLDDTYTMYYDDGNSGPLTWNIGNNASFKINGTEKTAHRFGSWFMWSGNDAWTFNIGDYGDFEVATGGGSINLDGFGNNGPVNWNFGKGAIIKINNLNTSASLISGSPGINSVINVNDSKLWRLQTKGGTVFDASADIPININGSGLRLHASTIYDGTGGINDLWKRVATGITNGQFSSANMTPTSYTNSDLAYLQTAKYIQFYTPDGMAMNASTPDRTYNVLLGTLPVNGSWSTLIPGNDQMQLNFTDDRGVKPNFQVQVTQLSNLTPGKTSYYWQNPDDTTATALSSSPYTIATLNSDTGLPSYITMTMAGG
ncbi:MAG: RTX toxin, partial [Lactobacillaceae bacterium]|nr:RTX toxin [Lactobacillaceae bacterium]